MSAVAGFVCVFPVSFLCSLKKKKNVFLPSSKDIFKQLLLSLCKSQE